MENYQELLMLNRDAWNEQELALHLIGPILGLVHFTEPYRFNLFAERRISAVVSADAGDVELTGEPDGIITTPLAVITRLSPTSFGTSCAFSKP